MHPPKHAHYAVQTFLQVQIRLNVWRCVNSEMEHENTQDLEITAGHREELISLPNE